MPQSPQEAGQGQRQYRQPQRFVRDEKRVLHDAARQVAHDEADGDDDEQERDGEPVEAARGGAVGYLSLQDRFPLPVRAAHLCDAMVDANRGADPQRRGFIPSPRPQSSPSVRKLEWRPRPMTMWS